ncbi:phage holin family protein [Lichenicoccus sp.]|uniref:phage holin family protein n=1 Tax=Lichenicoccus sp. TaxID=2781899 RepID=UPI003D11E49A
MIRPAELARTAAQAEIALLRAQLFRSLRRAVYAGIALLFGLFSLAFLHVAAFEWLRQYRTLGPVWAALIVMATDAVFVIVGGLLAAGAAPGLAEQTALERRRHATENLRQSLTVSALREAVVGTLLERVRALVHAGAVKFRRLRGELH